MTVSSGRRSGALPTLDERQRPATCWRQPAAERRRRVWGRFLQCVRRRARRDHQDLPKRQGGRRARACRARSDGGMGAPSPAWPAHRLVPGLYDRRSTCRGPSSRGVPHARFRGARRSGPAENRPLRAQTETARKVPSARFLRRAGSARSGAQSSTRAQALGLTRRGAFNDRRSGPTLDAARWSPVWSRIARLHRQSVSEAMRLSRARWAARPRRGRCWNGRAPSSQNMARSAST
jgi:hypothetical protein